MDKTAFIVFLNEIINEESQSFSDILSPSSKWGASLEFVSKMQELVERLCERFVHRASLFGQYRCDPDMSSSKKRARPLLMECKESDFNLAWQTLEQDSK